jgi:hypothetical protein
VDQLLVAFSNLSIRSTNASPGCGSGCSSCGTCWPPTRVNPCSFAGLGVLADAALRGDDGAVGDLQVADDAHLPAEHAVLADLGAARHHAARRVVGVLAHLHVVRDVDQVVELDATCGGWCCPVWRGRWRSWRRSPHHRSITTLPICGIFSAASGPVAKRKPSLPITVPAVDDAVGCPPRSPNRSSRPAKPWCCHRWITLSPMYACG